MFKDWKEHTALVKKSFGELGKAHPKMLQAYGALEQAAAAEALDAKTRELIAIAVAITTVARAASAFTPPPPPPKPVRPTARSQVHWQPPLP
ncbi:4-carboxymuconolactone decarboxylase [Neisseria gonorrhoeae]|nr:4-carboxymuconolactone decarboxylase [Neisseria gonorrhoeae]